MKSVFSRHGIPETVVTDNGPQYSSQEFAAFANQYGFTHTTSSPHFPQSNGHAERAVKTVKKLLKGAEDQYLALLSYRSTPLPWCGYSPAELSMGRRIRSDIPFTLDKLTPQWSYTKEFRQKDKDFKAKQKQNFDSRHKVKPLPDLPDDTEVWITTGTGPAAGRIISNANTSRSYMVDTARGPVCRNRTHLNVAPRQSTTPQPIQSTRSRIMTRSSTGTPVNPPDRLGAYTS